MMSVMAGPTIGKRIRLRRQALKLTQQQLADAVGVDRATVSAWERGRHMPERNEGAIEKALGISLADEEEPEVYTDPVERAIWEDPALPRSRKRALIEQLRAERREHVPRAQRPA